MIRDDLRKAIFQMDGTDKEKLLFVLNTMPLYAVIRVYEQLKNIQNPPAEQFNKGYKEF